jgi:hypothetical protein
MLIKLQKILYDAVTDQYIRCTHIKINDKVLYTKEYLGYSYRDSPIPRSGKRRANTASKTTKEI